MSRKLRFAYALAIFASVHTSAHAGEQQLWRYPCDVYMSSACFRLPIAMEVTYKVPADFGVYTVSSSGEELISAYVGTAPNLRGGTPTLTLDSTNATLTGFLDKKNGLNTVDIFVVSKQKGGVTVHFFGTYSSNKREAVAEILMGIRACQTRGKEDLWCPRESPWGEAVSKWIVADSH